MLTDVLNKVQYRRIASVSVSVSVSVTAVTGKSGFGRSLISADGDYIISKRKKLAYINLD